MPELETDTQAADAKRAEEKANLATWRPVMLLFLSPFVALILAAVFFWETTEPAPAVATEFTTLANSTGFNPAGNSDLYRDLVYADTVDGASVETLLRAIVTEAGSLPGVIVETTTCPDVIIVDGVSADSRCFIDGTEDGVAFDEYVDIVGVEGGGWTFQFPNGSLS
jgi:hypothetical protein